MNLQINKKLIIPSKEIEWRFSRSSGPGGQNVNKIESKVEIIFNIDKSQALNPYQKAILLKKLGTNVNNGSITLKVQEKRNQFRNRQIAIEKLISLLKEKLMSETKIRKVSTPTTASQRRRIESKKKRGELKRNRQNKLEKNF